MGEHPSFVTPNAGAGEVSSTGWRLRDESATSKLLVYADFAGDGGVARQLGVDFGASAAAGDGLLVCGVRPDEWLILASPVHEAGPTGSESAARPVPAEFPEGAAVVDVTHGLAMLRLTGPAAPTLLAAVCSIDTGEAMMPGGAVCGASVARVACTLVRNDVGGERSYLILADRSYGRYLFDALRDAGGPEPPPPAP